ncbi:Uncharacterised protein [Vibrio cholerae]|nr:Uncharacterised protein [Vibrio cholerae]
MGQWLFLGIESIQCIERSTHFRWADCVCCFG